MEEIKCKVCGDTFTPFKSRKYEVVVTSPLGGNYISEAFDCPMCGCQHVVNRRYPSTNDFDISYEITIKQVELANMEQMESEE